MPRFVEPADFDTNLFEFRVGRIELDEEDCLLPTKFPTLDDILRQAHSSGYKLVYLFAPARDVPCLTPEKDASDMDDVTRSMESSNKLTLPGLLVDVKTTYSASIFSFDRAALCTQAFLTTGFRIKKHDRTRDPFPSAALKRLAVVSGGHSRFKVDTSIPHRGYVAMFEAWIANSVNKSVADEVFIALSTKVHDRSASVDSAEEPDEQEVGFITVRRRGHNVSIGLLAVSDSYRRRGIASALLCRAALWAIEELGAEPDATLSVVTQGNNPGACSCYERFGFTKQSEQLVHHVWLPQHLSTYVSRTDSGPIPFCKQHLTGKEMSCTAQVLTAGRLDSASHFTMMCSSRIQELLMQRYNGYSSGEFSRQSSTDSAAAGAAGCSSDASSTQRVIMVPSGTAALEMAALLCDFTVGDEVIMPSYTFSSTANAIVLRGAVPVFVDVRPDTLNIDERCIESAITSRTRAICVVHYAGVACEMDTICAIAKKHKLFLIEDAAQALLSTYKGRALGSIGDFGCFSFHYTKNVISGEGGALAVNHSAKMARRALVVWEKGTNRYSGYNSVAHPGLLYDFMMGKVDKYEWIDIGSSYVPSELSCAVLWAQLEEVKTITAQRKAHFEVYHTGLADLAARKILTLPHVPRDCEGNGHIFFILLPNEEIRQKFEQGLKLRGISAFTHYVPLHLSPAGRKFCRTSTGSASNSSGHGSAQSDSDDTTVQGLQQQQQLPVTERIHGALLRLPMWVDMTEAQLQTVILAMHEIANDDVNSAAGTATTATTATTAGAVKHDASTDAIVAAVEVDRKL